MGKLFDRYMTLSNQDIADAIQQIHSIGMEKKANRVILLKTELSIEEVLLDYQEAFGTDTQINVVIKKSLTGICVDIGVKGPKMNPLEVTDNHAESMVLDYLNSGAKHSYQYGVNHVGFFFRIDDGKKIILRMLLAVVAGVLLGVFAPYLPESIFNVLELLFTKATGVIFGLMNMAATPVIFLCVIQGVISSGNVNSLRKNGITILKQYLLDMFIILVFTTSVAMLAFRIPLIGGQNNAETTEAIIDSIFSIFPNNIVGPFYDGDNIKAIVLGLIVAVAIIILKDRMPVTIGLVSELKNIFSLILDWIVKLTPIIIVLLISTNIWAGNSGVGLFGLWKLILVYVLVMAITLLVSIWRLTRVSDNKYLESLKYIIKVGIKGFITGSTMICYSDMERTLIDGFKLDEEDVNFALPLAVAFFQPVFVAFVLVALFFLSISGFTASLGWMVSFLMITYLLGAAVPPVTGAASALVLLLFTSLGIPEGFVSLAIPIVTLMDYPYTGWRVSISISEIAYTCKHKLRK